MGWVPPKLSGLIQIGLVINMVNIIFNRLQKYSKIFKGLYRIVYTKKNHVKQHDHRDQSVINLVKLAFDSIPSDIILKMGSFNLIIDTSDYGEFSSCEYSESLVPDFNFDKWESVGQYDYSDITQKMINKSKEEPIYNELFWVGSFYCHYSRSKLFEMTKQDPRITINDTNSWHWNNIKNREQPNNNNYVSMLDHCNYKYLIDFQGSGYSGRTKYLLHSGRPLFYISRYWNEYWFFDLKPFVHYIPVKEDLSDFYQNFEWTINNKEQAQAIANNALDYAKNNLKKSDIINKYKKILLTKGGICTTTL